MSHRPAGLLDPELSVAARRVLIAALRALEAHANGVIVVGAQAIYLRAVAADLDRLASFTSDADLGLSPAALQDEPKLEQAMAGAGFVLTREPGTWSRIEQVGTGQAAIAVDLLVPHTMSGRSSRTARSVRIPPHAQNTARQVSGLEAAVIDNDWMLVPSLEPDGQQSVRAKIAGVAALLVAKAFKIEDRLRDEGRRPGRLNDKDAADVIRLMQLPDADCVAARFDALLSDDDVGETVRTGLELLRAQFGSGGAKGIRMAVDALDGNMPARTVEALGPAYLRRMPAA